jgi:DNA-binding Lrp family transcriptional regulator
MHMIKIDKRDYLILSHLRTNARLSLTDISKKTRIPISTIYEKLKRGNIEFSLQHTCLLDFAKLGFSTHAKMTLKSDPRMRQGLSDYLVKHSNVNTVYKINNGYDFLIECVFRNLKELEEFAEKLEIEYKVKSYETYFIIDELKREAFLSEPELLNMLVPEMKA